MTDIGIMHYLEPATGWIVALIGLAAWWIKGIADRKRASTEGAVAEHSVSASMMTLMQAEIARLSERVAALEHDKEIKDTTITDLTAEKLRLTADLAAARLAHGAEIAAESLLKMAALAEASVLRARLSHEAGLVEATLEGARETGRVADAAEKAVAGGKA